MIQGLSAHRPDRQRVRGRKLSFVHVPVGRFASDEKIAQRIANYRALSGDELTEVIDRLETEDTEAILESVILDLRAPHGSSLKQLS